VHHVGCNLEADVMRWEGSRKMELGINRGNGMRGKETQRKAGKKDIKNGCELESIAAKAK
jgi:hypothetical protein